MSVPQNIVMDLNNVMHLLWAFSVFLSMKWNFIHKKGLGDIHMEKE